MSGRVVTVLGARGSAGATTLAVNLAAAVAQQAGKVLLVDLAAADPELGVGYYLGSRIERSLSDLEPLLAHGEIPPRVLKGYFQHHGSGVELLAGGAGADGRPAALTAFLEAARPVYRMIVIDAARPSAAGLSPAVDASDLVLLTTLSDPLSVKLAKDMLDRFQAQSYPPRLLQLALTQVANGASAEQIEKTLRREPLVTLPHDTAVAEGAERKQPFVLLRPRHAMSRAVTRLAERLLGEPELFPDAGHVRRAPTDGGRDDRRTPVRASSAPTWVQMKREVHARLRDEIDPGRFDPLLMKDSAHRESLSREVERRIRENIERLELPLFDRVAIAKFVRELLDEALGLGPLEDLLRDPEIAEIMVNGSKQIFVERRRGKIERYPFSFESEEHLRAVIERIIAPIGRRIDERTPMVDARLADGSRVNAILPPLSLKGACLTIRKFSNDIIDLEDLIELGTMTRNIADFLSACVKLGRNILVSGGTSSGKTTLLNCLCQQIPGDERIITIEDAAELQPRQEHVISLESRPPSIEGTGAIPIRKLLENALRMRPNRIIIGECRGAEALDMLQALNTGHNGSMTTIHANSPRDSLSRLETLTQFAASTLTESGIRAQIASAIHVIVQVARIEDGNRKVTQVSELRGLGESGWMLADLFRFEREGVQANGSVTGKFVALGVEPTFLTELQRRGITLPREMFWNTSPGES